MFTQIFNFLMGIDAFFWGYLGFTLFERGVNRITVAWGIGATSCAILAKATGRIKHDSSMIVTLKGGSMVIHPDEVGAVMSGPAEVTIH